ncbi:alpha/beta fold hydrolase [Rhodococcus chondri]|uniref:Prolyl oligopeptidase family serine peptidase n=1 Tax=Rhodococcus chondri TaxID=3065941 RepID=A0ABU7JY99_9NOCA|nr:alpha/beta fold hydrolase [Rhodococcus sp. CC-R104]MEE2034986.1 prolyl oligopeptidase family serine peptidase [Rhodococcus sp. CC-R104]
MTAFDDLDLYLALPRVTTLALSPDGNRVVVAQAVPDDKKTRYVEALWEIDPTGEAPARRLTHGDKGESNPTFTATGDLLFTAARGEDDAPVALWRLPAAGGEAEQLATRKGGIATVHTAAAAPRTVVTAAVLGHSDSDDERIRDARKDRSVSAILHTGYPIRYWDHDLGPDQPHLLDVGADGALKDLTPGLRGALRDAELDVAADGSFAASTWTVPAPLASRRITLVRIDLHTGLRVPLVDDETGDVSHPAISPDGTRVAYLHESVGDPETPPRVTVRVLDVAAGTTSIEAPDWDRRPTSVAWLPDNAGLVVTADDRGRAPIFRLRLGDAAAEAVTSDDAAYTDVRVAPDGASLYALRASYAMPAHPVRIGMTGEDTGRVTALRAPSAPPELPGRLTEIDTTAADGTPLRGWLTLPYTASADTPVPLLLWVHGGPLSSWNTWSWRWNPWLLVARGYAVLLPDPALSTGYGDDFVRRGWGRWGAEPYTDLMTITDATVARPDIDADRTAVMGGSFGGYMANWIAGHTDRFRAIVTHASLWALDQFAPTTDVAWYWQREMTPEMAVDNSPHLYVARIVTPMLVIHGDKDYRVPIGEGLRLWYELLNESGLPAEDDGNTVHRFLYFPSENHWILTPQHAEVWYRTVEAFLSEHVLGRSMPLPEVLG